MRQRKAHPGFSKAIKNLSPNRDQEARVPKGSPQGGQWTAIGKVLPTSTFNAKIAPLIVGSPELAAKLVPDQVRGFVAGYNAYIGGKKAGYIQANQMRKFLDNGEYKIEK